MSNTAPDWTAYVLEMEKILALELDEVRRCELLTQFTRIAGMAAPLMDFTLDDRLEIAGVYKA